MNFLFNNLLAARDEGAWIQIVIVVIIIVVGFIKSLISRTKTMMEQKSDDSGEEPPSISDKPKKRYVDDDGGFKTLEQLRAEKIKQIRAAYGIPELKEPQTVIVEEPLQPPAPEPQYIPQPTPIERPIHRPKPAAFSKIPAEKSKTHIHAQQPDSESVQKLLFSSSDDLRNAVIYQEILGKPLALRNE